MKDSSIISRKNVLVRPILIDGIGRAGKFLLAKVVSGFKGVEFFQYISLLEHIPYLEHLGVISEDAAIALLQCSINESAYNMRIGRNMNFRYEDASSLYNSHEINVYLKRSISNIDENIAETMRNDGKYSPFITHETLPNIQIFFKAFQNLKVIHLIRHPVDLVHSWYTRGWGYRFFNDHTVFIPLIKGKNISIPWYVLGWEQEYEKMSEMDRIIKSISIITEMEEGVYKSLSENQRDSICTILYEQLVENTLNEIKRMADFLQKDPSAGMKTVLSREECPKEISSLKRQTKMNDIKKMSSEKGYRLTLDMVDKYTHRKNKV